MMALMAPAEAPEMPSIANRPSASRWSSTPQVKAPCAPPPCSARLILFAAGWHAGREQARPEIGCHVWGADLPAAPHSAVQPPSIVIVRAGDCWPPRRRKEHRERGDLFDGDELLGRLGGEQHVAA